MQGERVLGFHGSGLPGSSLLRSVLVNNKKMRMSKDPVQVKERGRGAFGVYFGLEKIVATCFMLMFLSLLRLHPSLNEKALLLRCVRWHTIQAHAEKKNLGWRR